MGFISTDTPSSEGEHLEWFSAKVDLDKNPDKFRNFWERCEAFAREHEFGNINSPKTLLAFCSAFCEFTKGIFSSEDYIPTHLTRKLWLRIEGELRQKQCDQEPDPWAQFWSQTTMRELERCFPDQKHFLAPFGRNCRASEVSARFNGQHVLLISCWACLMRDAVNTFGVERCTELFRHNLPKVREFATTWRQSYGHDRPPSFFAIARHLLRNENSGVCKSISSADWLTVFPPEGVRPTALMQSTAETLKSFCRGAGLPVTGKKGYTR